jgi:hypothetical protein
VLAALYATPGLIGLLGVVARQRWLLIGAAVPLLIDSLLSWAGVTLVFLIPAGLLVAGATRTRAAEVSAPEGRLAIGGSALSALLVLAGGWAVLLGLTHEACVPIPGGESCSSAAVSVAGVVVGAICLVAALAIAAWVARPGRREVGA